MIDAAMVGLGWWGRTLVESVQGDSDVIRFVAGATRTKSPEVHGVRRGAEADAAPTATRRCSPTRTSTPIVLATPHSHARARR